MRPGTRGQTRPAARGQREAHADARWTQAVDPVPAPGAGGSETQKILSSMVHFCPFAKTQAVPWKTLLF